MNSSTRKERKARRRQRGQGMTEYGILVAVIAILSIAIVTQFGDQIRDLFFKSGDAMATGSDEINLENQMDQGDVNKSLGGGSE